MWITYYIKYGIILDAKFLNVLRKYDWTFVRIFLLTIFETLVYYWYNIINHVYTCNMYDSL